MANMSYCRFQNTASDLADCEEHIWDDDLSADEHNARARLIKAMVRMLNDVGADIDESDIDEGLLTRRRP